jgi:hypothetical protein
MNITKKGLFVKAFIISSECILKWHFFPWPKRSFPVDALSYPSMIKVGKSRNRIAIAGFCMLK